MSGPDRWDNVSYNERRRTARNRVPFRTVIIFYEKDNEKTANKIYVAEVKCVIFLCFISFQFFSALPKTNNILNDVF